MSNEQRQRRDPMDNHRCRPIARGYPLEEGRDYWLGELLEPIPGHPEETHCLHITTPYKSVVFGVNLGDMAMMTVFAAFVQGKPINPRWVENMMGVYKDHAEGKLVDEEP